LEGRAARAGIKLLAQEKELYILAQSRQRLSKELAFEDHRPSCIKQIPEAVLAGLE
jgi:hypothetical protein